MKKSMFVAMLFLIPCIGSAKSSREMRYRYDQIWNTAVRFLRVDNGYPITEKDVKSGYLIFKYTDAAATQIGSMELVETVRDTRRAVTVGLRIQNMPSYIEIMLLDKLERKLRDEYGEPPLLRPIVSGKMKSEKPQNEQPDEEADEQGSGAGETDDSQKQ